MGIVPNIFPTSGNVHFFSGNVACINIILELMAARLVEPGDLSSDGKNSQCQMAQRNSYGNRKYGGVIFFGTLEVSGAEPFGFGGI